jgi:hypothetical protein
MIRVTGDTRRYYAYEDKNAGRFYYHDPITNHVCWEPPEHGELIDAETLSPFSPLSPQRHVSEENLTVHISPSLRVVEARSGSFHRGSRASTRSSLAFNLSKDVPTVPSRIQRLPASIETDCHLVNFQQFADENLSRPNRSSFKRVSMDDLCTADENSSAAPVLNSVDSKNARLASAMFNYIVAYGKRRETTSLSKFMAMIRTSSQLVDEAFMQIIRQTRNNPNFEAALRMWEIFLALSTCFRPSAKMQPLIRQVLARAALGESKIVAQIAQVAYLRFDSRCRTNSDLRYMPDEFLDSIPSHPESCSFTMGASLFELMHRQQKSLPRCPIPVFVHRICQYLVQNGAFAQEGLFQQRASVPEIEKMATDLDCGQPFLKDPKSVASLFKRWLTELPVSVIPPEVYPKLLEKRASEAFVSVVQDMPDVNRNTLGYLVGFFKELARSEGKTKMGLVTVATMFGPSLLQMKFEDSRKVKEAAELGKLVLQTLIKEWDTAAWFPLDESCLS